MATGAWISGRLALEPRTVESDKGPVTLRVVSNRRIKDKTTGEFTYKGSFFNVVVWGDSRKLARSLTKGDSVVAIGRLEQDTYEKDGQSREQIQIVADSLASVPDGPTDLPATGDDW